MGRRLFGQGSSTSGAGGCLSLRMASARIGASVSACRLPMSSRTVLHDFGIAGARLQRGSIGNTSCCFPSRDGIQSHSLGQHSPLPFLVIWNHRSLYTPRSAWSPGKQQRAWAPSESPASPEFAILQPAPHIRSNGRCGHTRTRSRTSRLGLPERASDCESLPFHPSTLEFYLGFWSLEPVEA